MHDQHLAAAITLDSIWIHLLPDQIFENFEILLREATALKKVTPT